MRHIRAISRLPDTWPSIIRPMRGGKSQTSAGTSTTTIPPQVLQEYSQVNQQAQNTAQQPFQPYSGQFVAPINSTEQSGINQTQQYANAAQPYYQQAAGEQQYAHNIQGTALEYQNEANDITGQAQGYFSQANDIADSGLGYQQQGLAAEQGAAGLTLAGTAAANPTALTGQQINQYLSPYLGDVLGSTEALVNQQNQQQQAGQLGNAITSGAFGGDRTGIAAANLAQQEELAGANAYSTIANQGYNTALATAQQQQGLSLSAQQANLARLLQGGQQLSGIGTAAGQLGNNVTGVANTVGGLGAASTQLEGTVGQLGNNYAAIGNNVANIGNNIAGIGTASQQQGLAGAAQELTAGQLQQQTQQAQDTAQYNQFLQQQGYPFQVDQFLANIAEGTGSLSGSTTNSSSTQPAPFFSDERLKEDIEPIGQTFDGQNIIKFRYKGSPQKHIGLSAQDTEKSHPEAVGLAGGYKTVDYDAATKEAAGLGAAKRYASGGYADGGMPIGLGGGPADYEMLQQILQNAHSIQGASPGAQMMPNAGATPYGGLRTLGSVLESGQGGGRHIASQSPELWQQGKPQTGLSQLKQLTDLAGDGKSVGTDAGQAFDWLKGLGGPAQPAADPSTAGVYARGGYLSRDSGGEIDPYGDPNSYVPESSNDNIAERLAKFKAMQPKDPNQPAQSQSGLGQIAGAAGDAKAILGLGAAAAPYAGAAASGIGAELATLLPLLALARGGAARLHRDPGGSVLPALQDDETGPQSPEGADALRALLAAKQSGENPTPPPRPANLGNVSPPDNGRQLTVHPRGLGETANSDDPRVVPSSRNLYQGQTLTNPAGINDNSGATVSGLGRAVAAAPQSAADAVWSRMIPQESGGHQFDQSGRTLTSKTGAEGIAQVQPGTGPEAAQLAGLPWDPQRLASDKDYNLALGQAYYKKQLATFGSPDLAAAAYNAGPAAVQKALAQAQTNGDSYLKHLPAETQAYVANVAGVGNGRQRPEMAGNGIQVAQNDSPGGLGAIGKSITDAGNGVGDYMKANQSWLMPALSFLGTMAGSNSRYLGAAALQGLGGAAKTYEDVQNQQQQRDLQAAHAGLTQSETAEQRAATARGNIYTAGNRDWVLDKYGNPQMVGMAMNPNTGSVSVLGGAQAAAAQAPQQGANGAPAAPAPPPPPPAPVLKPGAPAANSMLGPAARETMAQDVQNMRINPPSPGDIKLSQDKEAQVNQNGDAALSQGHMINQLASELTAMPDEGLSGGAYNDQKIDVLRKFNDFVSTIGRPDWAIDKEDIAHNAASVKISQAMQFALSHGSGQDSSIALQAAGLATPSAHFDKVTAAEMLAGLYVDKQGAVDRQQYLKQYRYELANQSPAMANNYRAQNAMLAFNQDHNDIQYGKDKAKIAHFLAFPGKYKGQSPLNAFYNGDMSSDLLDRSLKTPGISRYFLNQGGS